MIIGIVAISKNFAIGKNGKLPWHYSSDLKFFKQTTTGNAIVMGWNTWKSIGRPLTNRINIVLSRRGDLDERPDLRLMRSRNEVLEFSTHAAGDLFIIGGSQTYKTFADWIEKWYVTEVPLEVEDADTFMPRDFLDGFELQSKIDLEDGLVVKVFQRK
jgi:dihydrofolate reductase